MPQLSVVIATLHRPALVVEAIHSALRQPGPSLEVLVIDDDPQGSARDVVEKLAAADPAGRVRYFARGEPSGGFPAVVYNDGLARAQGKYVLFLDDDDQALPGAFATLAGVLEQRPQDAFIFGLVEPFGGTPEAMIHETAFFLDAAARARAAVHNQVRFLRAQLFFGGTLFVTSSAMFRRELLLKAGGFDPRIRINAQLDLAARLARDHRWSLVDEKVVRYRIQPDSLMHDQRNQPDLDRSYLEMHRKLRQELGLLGYAWFRLYAKRMLSERG